MKSYHKLRSAALDDANAVALDELFVVYRHLQNHGPSSFFLGDHHLAAGVELGLQHGVFAVARWGKLTHFGRPAMLHLAGGWARQKREVA